MSREAAICPGMTSPRVKAQVFAIPGGRGCANVTRVASGWGGVASSCSSLKSVEGGDGGAQMIMSDTTVCHARGDVCWQCLFRARSGPRPVKQAAQRMTVRHMQRESRIPQQQTCKVGKLEVGSWLARVGSGEQPKRITGLVSSRPYAIQYRRRLAWSSSSSRLGCSGFRVVCLIDWIDRRLGLSAFAARPMMCGTLCCGGSVITAGRTSTCGKWTCEASHVFIPNQPRDCLRVELDRANWSFRRKIVIKVHYQHVCAAHYPRLIKKIVRKHGGIVYSTVLDLCCDL